MKNYTNYILPYIILILLISCKREDVTPEDLIKETKEQSSKENNNNNQQTDSGNTEDEKEYFFGFGYSGTSTSVTANIITDKAGSGEIVFNCNQSWRITTDGNFTNLTVCPIEGNGAGRVIYSFDAVPNPNYFSESASIIFHVKKGKKKTGGTDTTYSYHLYRRGNKMII